MRKRQGCGTRMRTINDEGRDDVDEDDDDEDNKEEEDEDDGQRTQ